MTHRVHVLIEGRVQGVGFRFMTAREALARDLKGWVRNLPDGRVEAEFEGAHEILEAMVAWCRTGPWLASVTNVDVHWETGEMKYTGFQIRD